MSKWQNFQKPNFQLSHSYTLNIIKSLLLLQEYTIEVEKYDFLYQYPRFSAFLAKLYDMHQIIPAENMQKYIRLVNDYTLENMKKRYLKIFSNYLIQRCYRDIHLQLFLNSPCKPQPLLQLSWLSFLFQKHTLTHQKISQVQSNMIEIYHCQDIPFLITYILQLRDPEDEVRGRCYPSQLQQAYDQCKIDILCSKNLLNYL